MTIFCNGDSRSSRTRTRSANGLLLALALSAWACGSSETVVGDATAGAGGASQGGSAGHAGANSAGANAAGTNNAGDAGAAGTGGSGGNSGTGAVGSSAGSGASGGASSDCSGDAAFVCCSADNSVLADARCVGDQFTCAPGLIRATAGVCEGSNEDKPDAAGCYAAGGACVGRGQCTGSVASAHDSECVFDDGPGECCRFPQPSESGDGCADYGGVCAPIGGCGRVVGYRITTDDCNQGPFMCCIPQSQCGAADVACCSEGTTWYASASCVRGELVCAVPDMELMRTEDCEALISQ